MRVLTTIALLLSLAACSGDGPTGPANDIAGSWAGTGNGFTISLTLAETNQQVSGNGLLKVPGALSVPAAGAVVSASGTFSRPNFSLVLSSQGFQDMMFTGTVSGSSASGTFTGSGFRDEPVALTRQ